MPANLSGIRIELENRYLTKLGETRQLKTVLLDASGQEISADDVVIEWLSTRAQDVSVDSQGVITALVGLGYSGVTAKVAGTDIQNTIVFDISDPNFFTTPVRSKQCPPGKSL